MQMACMLAVIEIVVSVKFAPLDAPVSSDKVFMPNDAGLTERGAGLELVFRWLCQPG